jgi:hypothetical protein
MKKLEKPILADGETTGHAHRLLDNTVDVYEQDNGLREFNLENDTILTHEEHNQITLPKGNWTSGIVQEYDHFLEETKNVID